MSVFKPLLLILSAASYNLALYAPSSPTAEDEVMGTSFRERIWKYAAIPTTIYLKTILWLAALAESAVIAVSLLGGTPFHSNSNSRVTPSSLVLNALGPAETSQLTAAFVTGALLVISGATVRLLCYRTLGEFFTVQQVLRKHHRLITRGPYAVVRHPGYTGLMMCIAGSCLMYATPGSWLTMSRVWSLLLVKVAVGGCGVLMAASVATLFRRVMEEDRFLAERFGTEWEVWARRVTYKLVPFVY